MRRVSFVGRVVGLDLGTVLLLFAATADIRRLVQKVTLYRLIDLADGSADDAVRATLATGSETPVNTGFGAERIFDAPGPVEAIILAGKGKPAGKTPVMQDLTSDG